MTFPPSNSSRHQRKTKQKKLIDLPHIDLDDNFDQLGKVAREPCQLRLIFSAGTLISIALQTSNPKLALMHILQLRK
jgi:hypothetical protein